MLAWTDGRKTLRRKPKERIPGEFAIQSATSQSAEHRLLHVLR